jgi:predicted DNA-binding protein (MmcQ/YjbR family)
MHLKRYEEIIHHCLSKPYVKEDFKMEWDAWRYRIGEKMFAMIGQDAERRDILSIKLNPIQGQRLREIYQEIHPGYYLNKVHWNSIDLSGSIPLEFIYDLIDESYDLIWNSLTRKQQIELKGNQNDY